MSRETRPLWQIQMDALQRLIMRHTLADTVPLYLVPEFPKSGGSWFCQMLSSYLGVPFPRNERPALFEASVLHGHFLYDSSFENVFCVVRDGRDIMVSAYHHYLFHHDRNPPQSILYHRRHVPFDDYENLRANLPAFIEYMFEGRWARFFRFGWDDFVRSYLEADVAMIKYEEMLDDAAHAVGRIVDEVLGIEPDVDDLKAIEWQYSFENQTGRERGEEDNESFIRKGIAGDWKNHFTREACETFDALGGDELIALGYEDDRSWIDRQDERFERRHVAE
jgi:hypothetical protein